MIAEKQLFDPERALEERTAEVDTRVSSAWDQHLASAIGDSSALLAVGGYGRRQLFPYSDVDLLLLVAGEKSATANKESISRFLQVLWDAGLRVSHSVRTPGECSELHDQNIELNVSLLDQRFLAGDRAIHGVLLERLPRFIHSQRDGLVRHLALMARERQAQYGGTFYHLEPNIKEAPGGLRDLQLVAWISQIVNTTASAMAPAERAPELSDARRFLFALRGYLHHHAKRDSNVLTFDAQEWVAEQTGVGEPGDLMRDYFRNARAVARSTVRALEIQEARTSSLFAQFRDWRSRLSNADFTVVRGRVYFRSPQQLEAEPDLLLRLLEFVARHGIRLSLEGEQRIENRLPAIREHFSRSRPIWPALRKMLSLPHASTALRSAHETGALRAIFPEMEGIDCLVIRDFYHRYTVDEHTLVAIQTFTKLRQSKGTGAEVFAGLASELEQPALLVYALLFHDVGKGSPDEGHVDASLRIAEGAMERIQMPDADCETVRFLIRSHLEMSATMNSRDMFDPATAQYLAHKTGTVEALKYLTLLTYADISAVNPTAMSAWRAEQLWQLYLLVYNELTRELETERIASSQSTEPSDVFLEGFPTRYLRTHSQADIERHKLLEQDSRARKVAVEIEKTGAAYRLTLVTGDRPFLFASVAGTLSSFGLNILKAEAFANRHGTVLDTFSFADPLRTLELNPTEMEHLKSTVEQVVLGRADVNKLLDRRPRIPPPSRTASIEATVHIDDKATQSATLIQVVAEDRPGLLYDIASTISSKGCSIDVVLIDTEAHKAIDVFYVTAEGQKLSESKQVDLAQALTAVLK